MTVLRTIIMVDLLRYQLFLTIAILFLQLWKTSLTHLDSIKSSWFASTLSSILGNNNNNVSDMTMKIIEGLVKYMPVWAIVVLGVYALFSVLYRVVTFGDCEGPTEELGKQIVDAKMKLKGAGFVF